MGHKSHISEFSPKTQKESFGKPKLISNVHFEGLSVCKRVKPENVQNLWQDLSPQCLLQMPMLARIVFTLAQLSHFFVEMSPHASIFT